MRRIFHMKIFTAILWSTVLALVSSEAQWTQTSGPSGGYVTQFAVNSSNGDVYAIANGDVYRSTNAGASWICASISLQANIGATIVAASGTTVIIGLSSGNTA